MGTIDLSPMPHLQNEHDKFSVFDVVNDAVVAGANSPLARSPDQPSGRGRPRIVAEQLERGLDAATSLGVELAELAGCCWSDGDAVRHAVTSGRDRP